MRNWEWEEYSEGFTGEGKMSEELKQRSKQYALRVIRLCESLPNTQTAQIIGKQLLRSGTSVGANYRAACRAKSPADFISKLGTAEEELDETLYWIEILIESNIVAEKRLTELTQEGNELLAIFVASITTAKRNRRQHP
jgi:four helix bundle protein